MRKKIIAIVFLVVGIVLNASSQDAVAEEEHEHDHFHANEIGISFAPVYFTNSKETFFGLHGHYVHRFGESRFGAGAGVEYIFNDEQHQTYSAVIQYSPLNRLHLVAAPGVAVEKHIDTPGEAAGHEAVFALHLEAFYEFEVGPIDLGPSFEFAYDPHDIHLSLGLHLAFPF